MITTLSIKVDSNLKNRAKKSLHSKGLTFTYAVNQYLKEIARDNVSNFTNLDISKSNPDESNRDMSSKTKIQWKKDVSQAIKTGKRYSNAKDFVKYLTS